jgi:membrane-bound ClpP family serine protease
MKTGAGLALIAFGAILAFAVNSTPSWLNLHVVGWVLMLVGLVGLVIPRSTYGWVNRRIQTRRTTYPATRVRPAQYTTRPASGSLEAGTAPQPTFVDQEDVIDGTTLNGEPTAPYRTVNGQTEVIEDVYEQP